MRLPVAAGLCLFGAWVAYCQSAPALPTFEVASIKPNQMTREERHGVAPANVKTTPGSLSIRNSSLSGCIQWAYNVGPFLISGPNWLESERFDITAKAAEPADEDRLKLMMQALLAERFKLAVHREEKVMSVYEVSVGKGGPKMKESAGDGEMSLNPTMGKPIVSVQRISVPWALDMLSRGLRAPVIDKTGLKGKFDFNLDLTAYITKDMRPDDLPSIAFTVLQKELGLKLESKKAPVEMLVIDHVERTPTEN